MVNNNKRQALISVIVPVYNAQTYLKRCVDSILCQTYEQLELILVDDGSTDDSSVICDNYAMIDRVKVFHTENAGVSSARNFGIGHATGEYLTFVDADDFISSQMLELLYNNLCEYGADVSIGNLYHTFTDQMIVEQREETISVWNNKQAIQKFLQAKDTSFFPVAKLFRKSLLTDYRFDSRYKLAEDALMLTQLYTAKTIKTVYSDRTVYAYFHHKNSATTTVNRKTVFDTIRVHANIYQLVSKLYPQLQQDLLTRRYWSYFVVLDKIIFDEKNFKNEIIELSQMLKRNFFKIIFDRSFSKGRKISLCFLFVSRHLYKACVTYNNRNLR